MTDPFVVGPGISRPPIDVGFHRPNPYHLQQLAKALTMTCPTAFSYEEAAALWHELQDAKAEHRKAVTEYTTGELEAARADAGRLRTELDNAKGRLELAEVAAERAVQDRDALSESLTAARADSAKANAEVAHFRAERDFARSALAEAHAATREARAERDRALALLGAVRAVVALGWIPPSWQA